jgi:hypothetical protein
MLATKTNQKKRHQSIDKDVIDMSLLDEEDESADRAEQEQIRTLVQKMISARLAKENIDQERNENHSVKKSNTSPSKKSSKKSDSKKSKNSSSRSSSPK